MKILIIRNAFTFDYGGGERFPINLAAELNKHGHHTMVVSRSPKLLGFAAACGIDHKKGWWWSRQNWSGRRALLFPVYCLWQILLAIWYLQLILRLRPQVVHPQSKDDFIAATLAGRLLGKRVIWTDHADLKYIFANHQVWYKNPVGKLVYLCSRLAYCVTLVSHSEQNLIEEQLGHSAPKHFTVIHNGINDTAVMPHPRTVAEKDAYIYCATSRLVVAKGIGELIEAFTRLHKRHADTTLWLVGDGPDASQFKSVASKNPAIEFIGHSDQPLRYVAACDVFIHPSYHEGFSLSLVEAAMLAKPIIACAVGGNVEIIHGDETGLLVPPKDPTALESAMEALYADRKRANGLARAARALYERDFQFKTIVTEQFLPLYESK